jgi:hypothetical protein
MEKSGVEMRCKKTYAIFEDLYDFFLAQISGSDTFSLEISGLPNVE